MYLEAAGFGVTHAARGDEGLRLAESDPPDLVMLDLMLPGLDGWEVCRRLRAAARTPIIMLTARADDGGQGVGLELGADDYITKPFNPRELVARVRAVLRRGGRAARTAGSGELPRSRRARLASRWAAARCSWRASGVQLTRRSSTLLVTLIETAGWC